MAINPQVVASVREELTHSGFGAGSAALLGGRCSAHSDLETTLSSLLGFESALIFSSGYLANLGALSSLLTKKDKVFHDRLNHASLIDGVLSAGCNHRRYPHLGHPVLQSNTPVEKIAIVTESIFSMDGDVADINTLESISRENQVLLYIDDAHGFGVINNGLGATGSINAKHCPENLIIMITLGKALGSFGGVILSSDKVREYLINYCRTFIYDTAIPPVAATAASEALSILINDGKPYHQLQKNIKYFKSLATKAGVDTKDSNSPIQPILFDSEEQAIKKEQQLRKNGFYVKAIRPPTVPAGTSRLRIVLSALHTFSQLDKLVDVLSLEKE
ncbi:MAG: hypothetical protein CBC29_03240 [Methylococcaceae bacterium TMED69]|nr:MAG: hypothetical protein CBC29_03240 [Methylococcaceae bacterium TMED69]